MRGQLDGWLERRWCGGGASALLTCASASATVFVVETIRWTMLTSAKVSGSRAFQLRTPPAAATAFGSDSERVDGGTVGLICDVVTGSSVVPSSVFSVDWESFAHSHSISPGRVDTADPIVSGRAG